MSDVDPFAHDDAAYVLGALAPAQRRAFEEHLAGCDSCAASVRQLAGMPGLLAHLDESSFTDPRAPEPVPETLLPQLLRSVRRQRRRTRFVAVAGLAAAAALAVALTLSLFGGSPSDPEAGPPSREMVQVDQQWLEATVSLEQVAWGTRLHLACTYEGTGWGSDAPPSYALVVHTSDGTQSVATWRAVAGRTTELDAATDADPDQITAVDVVVVGTGRKVLTLATPTP